LRLVGLEKTVRRIPGVSATTTVLKDGQQGLQSDLSSVRRM